MSLIEKRYFPHLLALVVIILSGLYTAKSVFICFDKENKVFRTNNFLFDDGGNYLSQMRVFNNKAFFEEQVWFQEFKNNLTEKELQRYWGEWAPRIKRIAAPTKYFLFFTFLKGIDLFVGDMVKVYSISLVFLTFFIFLKYAGLLFFTRKDSLLPLILMNVLYDFNYLPNFQGSEDFANQLVLMGLGLLFFTEREVLKRVGAAVLLAGTLFSVLPMVLVFALVLAFVIKVDFFKKNFGPYVFGILLSILMFATLKMGLDVRSYGKFYYNWGVRSFIRMQYEYGLLPVLAFFAVHLINKHWTTKNKQTEHLLSALVILLGGGVAFSALSPFLPDVDMASNGFRFAVYMVMLALMVVAQYLTAHKDPNMHKLLLSLCLVFFARKFISDDFLRIPYYQTFQEQHFPAEISAPNAKYFLARDPQQVYGYFIREDYLKGPLILGLETKNYSPEKILGRLSIQGPPPEDMIQKQAKY